LILAVAPSYSSYSVTLHSGGEIGTPTELSPSAFGIG
jgi:hypothetical protein